MTAYLPGPLLKLFTPIEHPEWFEQKKDGDDAAAEGDGADGAKKPLSRALEYAPSWDKKYVAPAGGISEYTVFFETAAEMTPATRADTKEEREAKKLVAREERLTTKMGEAKAKWDPYNDANAKGDAFKTLFVGRLSYDVTESMLKREFDAYGPIAHCRVVTDVASGKSRGYGFVEYEHEADLKDAYKRADGKKIEGKRIVVDVERGRTVKSWLPRKLGGGKGKTRLGPPSVCVKTSGRDEPAGSSSSRSSGGGGSSGGYGGGYSSRGGSDRDRGYRRDSRSDDSYRGGRDDYRGGRDDYRGGGGDRDRRSDRGSDRDRERGRDRDRDRSRRERSRSRDRDRDRERRSSRGSDAFPAGGGIGGPPAGPPPAGPPPGGMAPLPGAGLGPPPAGPPPGGMAPPSGPPPQ